MAARWVAQGHEVAAVTRSPARAKELLGGGIRPIEGDLLDAGFPALGPFEAVFFGVGFDRKAGRTIGEVYLRSLRTVLDRLSARPPRRLIYISSTGVYGDAAGEWIDEETVCEPTREGGKACLAAENLLGSDAWNERSLILRLAGIYGPGRLPNQLDLLAGKPLSAAREGFLNLIYVDDAAEAVDLAIEKGVPPRVYLVSDGAPVIREEYYREAARQLGAPEPQFEAGPAVSQSGASRVERGTASKRVSNARLVSELGFAPRYKDYREGIAAALREEAAPK